MNKPDPVKQKEDQTDDMKKEQTPTRPFSVLLADLRGNDKTKKINRFVFFVFLPLLCLAGILYVFSAPPALDLGEGFSLRPASANRKHSILFQGGIELIPASEIALWGNYPWIYGKSSYPHAAFFIIDLKEQNVEFFPDEELDPIRYQEFFRFANTYGFELKKMMAYHDFFPSDGDHEKIALRKQLRKQLSRPYEPLTIFPKKTSSANAPQHN